MNLEAEEHIILNEGKLGWRKTLALTNQRLLFLNNDAVEDEIALADVAEAYPDTQGFTNLTQLKIKMRRGGDRAVIFKSGGAKLLFGGMDYADQNARSMSNRYASAIMRAVDSLQK